MKAKLKNSFRRSNLFPVAAVLSTPAVSYLILGPLEIYSANVEEFLFGALDFSWMFWLAAACFLVFGTAVLCLLPQKPRKIALSAVFGFSFLSYLQSMFLNRNLMNADGSRILWSERRQEMIVNLIVWGLLLVLLTVLPLILKKDIVKLYAYAGAFLSCIQMVAYVSLLVTTPIQGTAEDSMIFSGRDQYSAAKNGNIIVLILDSYSGNAYDRFTESQPERKGTFKDFTYYNNADCAYAFTFPSIVHMLTGKELDPEEQLKVAQWKDAAWTSGRSEAFYETLHQKGYTCNLYVGNQPKYSVGSNESIHGKFDNFTVGKKTINYPLLLRFLEKLTVYKNAPYILKPRFETEMGHFSDIVIYENEENDGQIYHDNGVYYEHLKQEKMHINQDFDKAFIVTHLDGLHSPLTIDENARPCSEPTLKQAQAGIDLILNEYFRQLKEIGVYDGATIMVIADHGHGSGMQPVYFIKRAGEEHEEMQVNSAPVSHSDFQATILEIIGEEHQEYGRSIFDWKPEDVRERTLMVNKEGSLYMVYRYTGGREDYSAKYESDEYELLDMGLDW